MRKLVILALWDRWHIAAEKVTSTPLELKCKYAAELPDSAWAGACKEWFTDGNGTAWGLQAERLNANGLLVCKYGGSR